MNIGIMDPATTWAFFRNFRETVTVNRQASPVMRQGPVAPRQAFQKAVSLHNQGRMREAEQFYEIVLKSDERHFGAINGLGLIRLQQGRFDDAAALFHRAIKIDKKSADAHFHLAVAATALRRPEEAIRHYEKVLAIRPDFAEAHNNLGHALQMTGRPEQGIAHFKKALAIRPNYAEARNNLGNALYMLGNFEHAILHYEKSLAVKPDYPEAYWNLGNALRELDRLQEAASAFHKAIAIRPNYAEAHDSLGYALQRLGRSQEAMAHYAKAIALNGNYPEAHNNIGGALRALGRSDEAVQAFEKAIDLAPRKAIYYRNLAVSKRFAAGDPHLIRMQELAADMQSLDLEDQMELHFALGKALADLGDEEHSFQHLLLGNALKRQRTIYNENSVLEQFARIRATFTPELIRSKQGQGHPSSLPVFIVGMPRSGTTLIEQIIASHSRVFGAGELPNLGRLAGAVIGADGTGFPEVVPGIMAEGLREFGARYVRSIADIAPAGAERVTDKMPANLSYAGLICLALPNARIIHVRRDLRDTALSCFSILFQQAHEFAYDLAELGRYCRAYETLMQHWRGVLPQEAMLEVHYEDVVRDLEVQARRLIAHCGLEWEDACLAFYKTERLVRTASATQVRQPLYGNSVGRWRRYQHLLQPLLSALDGDCEP